LNDSDAPNLSPLDVKRLAERALAFQRYVFKKAWAVYYAIWACTFAVYIYLPFLVGALDSHYNLGTGYLLINVGVSALAGWVSTGMIEKTRNTLLVQNALKAPSNTIDRKRKWFVVWWIVYFGIIVASAFLFNAHLLTILFGLGTAVTPFFYYMLRTSFPKKMPFEGVVAILVFCLVDVASFVISFFAPNPIIYGVLWTATIVAWLAASVRSFLTAAGELSLEEA
jgi:hypothetical protein